MINFANYFRKDGKMKPTRILFLYLLSVLIVACNKEVPTRVQITPNQL